MLIYFGLKQLFEYLIQRNVLDSKKNGITVLFLCISPDVVGGSPDFSLLYLTLVVLNILSSGEFEADDLGIYKNNAVTNSKMCNLNYCEM